MQVSYKWLKEYVDLSLSPQELAKALTGRGVTVEQVTARNPGVEGVLIGRVESIVRHPQADTLWVCQVDVGRAEPIQVVTGAANVKQGDLVPAAVPGSRLPGMEMTVRELRGMESHGMLCSPEELGIDEGGDGILILPPDPTLAPGMDAVEALGLNDWILELDLTANYASHCQSMVGVAQEVAAILGTDLRYPDTYTNDQPNTDAAKMVSVAIDDPDLCARYTARILRGVTVGPSPAWLQARVRAAGMRPISNIVDISNFVMLELGQPLHTFDYQKIVGKRIGVRRAEPAERMTTLDGQERVLDPDVLVITDGSGPVAMAGVMGGRETEVTDQTTDILIESAHFHNINNRRTSLRLNLPSEAARRFTKGVDPSGCLQASNRAAQLIAALAGGKIVRGHVDAYPAPVVPPVIILRPAKVNGHLGLRIRTEKMVAHLERLGMKVLSPAELAADLAAGPPDQAGGDDLSGRPVWAAMHQVSPVPTDPEAYANWSAAARIALEAAGARLEEPGVQKSLVVVAPTRRLDLAAEVDLIEEIARAEGYDAIPATLPVLATSQGGRTPLARQVLLARQAMAAAGLDEVVTHSLVHPRVYDKLRLAADSHHRRYLTLANPMYEERSTLRTTLLPSLLDALQYNANRQVRDVSIFELSHTYLPREQEPLPEEPLMLGIAMMGSQTATGWNSPARPADFYAIKGMVEHLLDALNIPNWSLGRSAHPSLHPGRQALLLVDGIPCGGFGELHPAVQEAWDLPDRVYVAELDFQSLLGGAHAMRQYRPVPRHPAVSRDVALVIRADTPAARVAAAIRAAGGDLIEAVHLFDLYEGEHVRQGHRSLAYRIIYRASDRTLTDGELEPVHERVRAALKKLGAELRS